MADRNHKHNHKHYLGDGAYVDFDGFGLILTAEDGYKPTDTVYLEPAVWAELKKYVDTLKAAENLEKL